MYKGTTAEGSSALHSFVGILMLFGVPLIRQRETPKIAKQRKSRVKKALLTSTIRRRPQAAARGPRRVPFSGCSKLDTDAQARARRRFEQAIAVASHQSFGSLAAFNKAEKTEEDQALEAQRAALSNNVAACCVKIKQRSI